MPRTTYDYAVVSIPRLSPREVQDILDAQGQNGYRLHSITPLTYVNGQGNLVVEPTVIMERIVEHED